MQLLKPQTIKHRSLRGGIDSGRLLIISDLHIWGTEDPLYRALFKFLEEETKQGDTLFVLGDLFDIFIGQKAIFYNKYKDLFAMFIERSQSFDLDIYYLEGNHDFHLGGLFKNSPGIKTLKGDFIYEWNSKRIFFTHGDTVNPNDYGYMVWKFLLHNPLSKGLIAAIPGHILNQIGVHLSAASRAYSPQANEQTIRLFRNYACEKISNGYDFVIMGHSHFCDDIKFTCGGHQGQYLNVGFPRKDRVYIEAVPSGEYMKLCSWQEHINPLAGQ